MGILINIVNSLLGYNDIKGVTNNPLQRAFDWQRRYQSIPMKVGTSDFITIEPGSSAVLFDGTRSLATPFTAGSTELDITKLDSAKSLYRLKISSGPGAFRTERATSFNASTEITTTVNNNAVMNLILTDGLNGDFSNAQVGDIVRIKGVSTGDLSQNAFTAANSGYWVILSKDISNLKITVKRPSGTQFQGLNETVTLGADLTSEQIRIYSAAGVQISDCFMISGSFSSASYSDYEVQQVGPDFIDFVSGQPLPEENGVQLASLDDLVFYSNAKKIVYIETDQDIAVRYNQDASQNNIVKPLKVGNESLVGFINKSGFTWKCEVVNLSQVNYANVKWITAE